MIRETGTPRTSPRRRRLDPVRLARRVSFFGAVSVTTGAGAGLGFPGSIGAPSELHAQTILSAGGLGIPVGVPDGRGRMLGGIAVGLSGTHFTATDPAAAARAILPGIHATVETTGATFDESETATRTRFPAFGIVYPYGRLVYIVGFSGVMTQGWRGEVRQTLDLGAGNEVEVTDRFEGAGGINAFHLGASRMLGSSLSVGASARFYTGSMTRFFSRDLNPDDIGPGVEPFVSAGQWRAEGISGVASLSWDLHRLVRIGAGATWGGDLDLVPRTGTSGSTVRVPLPVELRAGADVRLTPDVGLTAAIQRADWGDAARALDDAGAPGTVGSWGVGVEWGGSRLLGRRAPIAIGYRAGELPFTFLGGAARESAMTGGVSMHLAEVDGIPLALLQVGVDRGTRSTSDWDERFWRTTVTLSISGR